MFLRVGGNRVPREQTFEHIFRVKEKANRDHLNEVTHLNSGLSCHNREACLPASYSALQFHMSLFVPLPLQRNYLAAQLCY